MDSEDRETIEAVRGGDRERFAELIERHKRKVYAIAWSYLGDADICEDAAQETFIRAFRHLGALRDLDRFGGWLGRIARNVSKTMLRGRRSELSRQRRWLMEQPAAAQPEIADGEPERLADLVAEALRELSPQHRECLVLFYLQGKSIREAAAALGVSEGTVKTRLHRARHAMRGRLEAQIEREMDGLTPPRDFTRSVMAVLPLHPIGLAMATGGGATTLGAKLFGTLGKLWSSLALGLWIVLGQAGIFYGLMSWYARMEAANLHKTPQNEFRARLLRRNALMVGLVALCVMTIASLAVPRIGLVVYFRIFAAYCAFGLYKALRLLRVNRSAFVYGNLFTISMFCVCFTLIDFFGGSFILFFAAMIAINLVLVWTNRTAPRRQDYNLFLRAARGELGAAAATPPLEKHVTLPEMRAFARFLGSHWLIRDYSLRGRGLLLRLPAVRMSIANSFLLLDIGGSTIRIGPAGDCQAAIGHADLKSIRKLTAGQPDPDALQAAVSGVLRTALALFLRGKKDQAAALLSSVDDRAIFKTQYARTRGYRIQAGIAIAASIIMIVSGLFVFHDWEGRPVTRSMVAASFSDWTGSALRETYDNTGIHRIPWELESLWNSPVHPSMALIGSQNAPAYRRVVAWVLREQRPDEDQWLVDARILNDLQSEGLLYHAVEVPILSDEELASLGFTPVRVRAAIERATPEVRHNLLDFGTRRTLTVNDHTVLDIEKCAMQLALLKHFNCLSFLDTEAVARLIADHQVSGQSEHFSSPIPVDRQVARGLFVFGRCRLDETRAALQALKTLGRLDLVDREACIEGIIRSYRGQGFFWADADPRDSGIRIRGEPENAYAAMESLAMLDALGRIRDFEDWKFHPKTANGTLNGRAYKDHITAESLKVWAYQERLEQLKPEWRREVALRAK